MDEKPDRDEREQLLIELDSIEKQGVGIWLEGAKSTPLQVLEAYMVRENAHYMRDYVSDEEGVLRELRFDKIKEQ